MGKSKQTSQKSEREKKKKRKREEKAEKKALRKANSGKDKSFESMLAYVDHNGQLSDTPPDPKLKPNIKAEDILLGARSFIPQVENNELTGRITSFNEDKGYGFIKDSMSKENIFFHFSNLIGEVAQGDMVTYELIRTPKGMNAVKVTKKA
jgi:cold shock CspA family protein